jgi:hypothetical protein
MTKSNNCTVENQKFIETCGLLKSQAHIGQSLDTYLDLEPGRQRSCPSITLTPQKRKPHEIR